MTKKMMHRFTTAYHLAAPAHAKSANKNVEASSLHLIAEAKEMHSKPEYSMVKNHLDYWTRAQHQHSLLPMT
jgi:hypothetical protein